jgi:hypothetical protein
MVAGAVEGLLLARLIALLFAGREDNPILYILLLSSAPLVWPWRWLDRWVGQPLIGARLELATLAAMLAVALIAGVWSMIRRRRRLVEASYHG